MQNNIFSHDLKKELGTNFIEYAVAVNTDRAIPDAKSGLKPVAKRIIYDAYISGNGSSKPHVKCAAIVGDTMGRFHPHGDSSIYGALVRLSEDWTMRYPLIDFHGNKGNRDGDEPASYRYTEARLAKITEDGMLSGMKKNNVDYIPNYSETEREPVTLPSIFPNLLCNPNTGIGVAMACNWAPHNLGEVANAIYDYIDGQEPMLPGPDFPTGGIIINKNDIPSIMNTGHGSVKIRGKYIVEDNNIVFTELPFGVPTEPLIEEIGQLCDNNEINDVVNIRNESTIKKGFRLVIECSKNANISKIIAQLFQKTDLQSSFSYNQVALIDKVPTELNLKDCCKIYVEHNSDCIKREAQFDRLKAQARLNIVEGLLKALENIDNIIALIKKSENSSKAKDELIKQYGFNENQAKAIIDMKLGRLAGLERLEIENEKADLLDQIKEFESILNNPIEELKKRLTALVAKYGDKRRTELTQIAEAKTKEEKEIQEIPPEKCVVVLTEGGTIKRIPATSFKAQKRNGKGVKTQEDITSMVIRTNTIDSLMIFSDKGKMYRLIVNDVPEGTNSSKGINIKALVEMEKDENPSVIYSIYRDTDAKYVVFVTKNGIIKKTLLDEYIKTRKKTGIAAISLADNDELASVFLVKEEPIILISAQGRIIKFNSTDINPQGRTTMGVKGINLSEGDKVTAALAIRDSKDSIAIFSEKGLGKKILPTEIVIQKRGGKGVSIYKPTDITGQVICAAMVSDEDNLLVVGKTKSICISAKELPALGRTSIGNQILKDNNVIGVSKI